MDSAVLVVSCLYLRVSVTSDTCNISTSLSLNRYSSPCPRYTLLLYKLGRCRFTFDKLILGFGNNRHVSPLQFNNCSEINAFCTSWQYNPSTTTGPINYTLYLGKQPLHLIYTHGPVYCRRAVFTSARKGTYPSSTLPWRCCKVVRHV